MSTAVETARVALEARIKPLRDERESLQGEIRTGVARSDELLGLIEQITQAIDARFAELNEGVSEPIRAYLDQSQAQRIEKARGQLPWVIGGEGLEKKPTKPAKSGSPQIAEKEDPELSSLKRQRGALKAELEECRRHLSELSGRESTLATQIDALQEELDETDISDAERVRRLQDLSKHQSLLKHKRRQHLLAQGVRPEELARRPRRGR